MGTETTVPSIRLSVFLSVSQSIGRSVGQSVGRSVGRSVGQSVGRSIDQSINQSINQLTDESTNQFSSGPPVTLLHNPLHFLIPLQVMIFVFLLVKKSLFALAISYPPCILHVHTISMHCFPFFPKLFVLLHFFSDYFISHFL
jgi:hypothetical protein